MSVELLIDNYAISNKEDSKLTAAASAAAVALTVENSEGFTALDYILLESPGNEKSEIRQVSGITDETTIAVDALDLGHAKNVPVYLLEYNQIKIYRATSKTGTYSEVTTVDMEYDEDYTQYTDTAGTTSSWYKVTYYNEQTAAETDVDTASPVRGGIELIAAPAHPRANTYVSLAEANEYFSMYFGSTTWSTSSDNDRSKALIEATRIIDGLRFHYDVLQERKQRLKWPRTNSKRSTGNPDSATTTTIVDSDLQDKRTMPDDFWLYGSVWFYNENDANFNKYYQITAFDSSTGTITIDGTFDNTVQTTDQYELIEGIPDAIRYAVMETAEAVLANLLVASATSNIKRQKLGDEEVEYFDKSVQSVEIPAKAMGFVKPYLSTGARVVSRNLFR